MTTKKNFGKRILSLALVLLMVLSLIPMSVMATDTDQPWLDSSVTATMDGITLYIPEVYCDDCGENVQDAELVIDSVDYAVGTLRVKYHLGHHPCFEISTKSNTISIDDFDCTTEYNEYPVYANAWDQTTTEPVAYLSREAGHIFDEGESNTCAFCGEMVQTGWVYDSGNWYYYYEDGTMATNVVISNENDSYYVGSDGVMVVNQKVLVDGVWYQAAEDGTLEPLGFDNRWDLDSDNWYYYYEDGTMATNVVISNENGSYYFGSDGALVVNQKVKVDGVWYQAAEDGRLEPLETDTHNYVNGFCTGCGVIESATDENEDGVFEIGNAGQLYWFAEFVNAGNTSANAILTADIVVNKGVITEETLVGNYWISIGSQYNQYTGTFDGNNHVISGLRSDKENSSYVGLFGYVGKNGVVKNTGVINSYFNNYSAIGSVAGGNEGTIINCYNTGMACAADSCVAGVVGENRGIVENCYNTGYIMCRNFVGGVVGYNTGVITNCYNTGTVGGERYIGGMVGLNEGTITNCYYLDTCGASDGNASSKTSDEFNSGEVAYLLQEGQTEEIWGQKLGTEASPTLGGDKVYQVENCIGDPVYSNANENIDHNFVNGFCTVCGGFEPATDENEDGVFEIGNAGQLYWFAEYVNAGNISANAILTDNIVVNEGEMASDSTDVRVWTPIGNKRNKYKGTFDGNNKTVSGLYFNNSEAEYVGLFGYMGEMGAVNGAVKNIGIINSYFKGLMFVGGVVGYAQGITITNCYNTSTVVGQNYAGGIAGYAEESTVANCYSTGVIDGTDGIGMIGWVMNITVENCYYLNTSCDVGIGNVSDTERSIKPKTAEAFASGEVAYLLQGEQEELVWGQTIGTETAPVLGGDKVYYGYVTCADDATAVYTNNSSAPADKPDHNFVNGFCTVCDTFEPATDENEDGVYEISNAGQLYWFAAVVNEGYGAVAQNAEVHAKLMADIIVNEGPLTYNTADARVWIPIGKCQSASYGGPGEGVAFKGTFDGNGFTISGLYHPYSKEMYDYAGFIGCLQGDNSQVKDLGIINCFIWSRYIAAGIVGTNDGGTVENCYVTGTISTGEHGAGIAGKNTGTVTECYNDALIDGLSFGGGIVAFNEGTVSKCYNIGECRFDTGGGIAYQSTGLVEECYNVVDLSFSRHGAGIVWNGNGEVIRCYNTGNISSPLFNVCGVAGVADKIIDCYNTGDISGDTAFGVGSSYTLVKNCYNTGRITAKSYAVGVCPTDGIVTSENCYYLEGMVTSAGTVDVDVQGKSEAKSAEEFTSGEVAYLLQNNREEQIWGQKLGEENIPQFSENKVYKNQIGGCKEENFVYEYSNTQEDAVTTHPGEWIIDASWYPESSESCYVYIDVYCNDCGDYLDYTSCEAELISEEAPINCQNPGKREWSCTFTVSDRTFTETYTEVLRNDVHTDLNDDGFCTACGGYEKPEVDPGEDPEWDYDDVYLIYNAGQLYWFAEHVNNVNNGIYGKLMADIDLNPGFTFKSDGSYSFGGIEGPFGGGIIGLEPPRMWTPIGSGSLCYAGNFDGNGFVVSGAYAVSENYYVGLFGNTDYNYEIKNLGISNSYFEGSAYVGGLVGYAYTYIQNCYVTDTVYVNGGSNTAALVGYNGVEIWNSYAMSDTLTDGGWGSLYNCYYLADEEIHNEDGLTFKTAEQFESGEVAYLLQSGVVGEEIWDDELGEYVQTEPEHIWGQKIGEDTYPVFGGDKVYTVNNCIDEVAGYSNTEGEILDHIDYDENGFCILCGDFEPATLNEDGVYEIGNVGQLYWFAEYVNAGNVSADAILTADIVVNEGTVTESSTDARVWTPIGNWSNKYTGTFDGNDYTVSGLYFNDSEVQYVGLFGVIGENGAVKNTGVINSYFNGDECVGGVSGYNFGTVTNCYSTAKISADRFAGGIVGCSYGIVANSYNTGKVNGNNSVSGVVGVSQFGTIINCYNTGEVSGTTNVGGILGESYSATIANCYNTGTVNGNYCFGAIFGYGRNYDASNCYYLDSSCSFGTGDDSVYGPITSIAKTSGAFASGEVAYLLGDAFGQKIGTDELPTIGGDKVYYGYLSCADDATAEYTNNSNAVAEKGHNFVNGFCVFCDVFEPATLNEDGVYEIGNAGQLYWFADKVNNDNANFGSANAILTADIVVNEGVMTAETEGARVWTPIGNWNNSYTGTFDGNNYTVSGLYFNNTDIYDVGLFGYIGENGAVKNTGVINSYFNGNFYVGGVVGSNYGKITNCYNTGDVSATEQVGGVVGFHIRGTIENCYNSGSVSGSKEVGGVVGDIYSATISNCYNTGSVSGTGRYIGGVVGSISDGTISDCYNTGTVSGADYVGGVVGYNPVGTIIDCYNTGEVSGTEEVGGVVGSNYATVTNCYNTGTVSGSSYVGGVVGDNDDGTITNCYYLDTACSGGINGADAVGSAEAKTAEQFASGEVAYLLQGEQEELVWGQAIGTDELPTIGGDKVYYGYASCADDVAEYTNNSNVVAERPDHNFVNGSCTACGVNALFYAERTVDYDGDVSDESKYFMQLEDALRYAEKSTQNITTYYSECATVKILCNYAIDESVTVTVPSNVTLDLNGFELTNNGTINFESIDGFKVSGGNYTGEGTVKIDEYDGIIFENTLYYFGGEYTPDTNVKRDLAKEKDRTYFTAGEGYAIYTNADVAVLNLYDATIYSNKEGVGDSSTVAVYYSGEDTLTVNFYGENNLYSEADLCVMGIETLGGLVLNGMGDNPVLNINGEEAESYTYGITGNDITINSGTINVTVSNAGTDSSNGIASSQNLTVANGATLNLVTGDANSISAGIVVSGNMTNNGTISAQFGKGMLSTGVFLYAAEEPMGTGTINAIVLGLANADGETPVLKYYTSGEALVYTHFAPATMIAKSEFLVSSGSTLVIREDAVADLTLLSAEDITIEGEVAVDGSLLLPEGASVLDIKDNLTSPTDDGTVCIGENGYYYFENGNLKCGNEESHFTAEDSDNTANCKHKAICDICGAEYGDTNDIHIGDIIPEFDWGKPYDGECYVSVELYCAECGDYVDSASGYAALKETSEAEDCMHPGSEFYEVSFEYEGVTYTDTKSFTLKSDNHIGEFVNGFCSECGGFEPAKYNEETGVYEISNAGQLYWYAQKLNEENAEIYAKLINDIVIPEDAPNWTPINCSYAFFDGNFKTVSGLKCVGGESDSYVGLFGMEGWWYEISNLHITDSYFEGNSYVGAVVAWMTNGGSVTNCCVTNTTVKGDSYTVGTLVGKLSTGNVINCYVDTDSLVGYYNDGYCTVENSYYLADTDDGNGGKTKEQFESGEVAYLLQGEQEEEIWGQKIGTDDYPVLSGDKVYYVTNCKSENIYSNTNENGQHNFVDGTCTICGTMDGIAQVKGYSISLGGNIAVKYYMVLSDEVLADENAEMVFTVPSGGSTYEVRIPVSSVTPDANGYYVFICEVAAKEMTSKIAAQIVTSDKESDAFEYSVKQYAEYILAKAEEANNLVGGGVAGGIAGGAGASNLLTPEMLSYVNAAPLVKAMLNYGANAQLYFIHNTDNLANATLDEADKVLVDNLDLSGYNSTVEGSEEGVTFYGGTLSLKSETAIKLYFVVEGDASVLTVTVNGEETELVKNGNLYELKISDIPAHKLSEMYEVKVGGLTINYGAFSYGYQAMNTGKEALVNAIKALYAYNKKAVEYLG